MNTLFSDNKQTNQDTAKALQDADQKSHQNEKLKDLISLDGDALKQEELIEIFMKKERDKFKEQGLHDFSSLPFYQQKQMIYRNPLFTKVIKPMPKGGLLHIHSTAGLSLQMMIAVMIDWNLQFNEAEKDKKIYIQTCDVLDAQLIYPIGTLCYKYQLTKDLTPFFTEFCSFMERENAISQLYEWLSFETATIEKIPYIWDQFNLIFSRTASLFKNREFYKKYHIALFEECIADKIDYIELRCGFEVFDKYPTNMPVSNTPQDFTLAKRRTIKDYTATKALYFSEMNLTLDPNSPDTAFLDAISEAIKHVNPNPKTPQLKVRVILNANRSLNPKVQSEREKICQKIDAAISIINPFNTPNPSSPYHDMVIGFDFVGEEDRGQTPDSYLDIIYEVSESKLANNKKRIECINLFLHNGESNWSDNENIFEAVLLSKHRIGHGINLNKYPALIKKMKESPDGLLEPVLEICPISNQLLRYFPDLRNHSLIELKKNGINCVICNDDPQILGNPGLSFDFWQVYMNMGVTLNDLKEFIFLTYFYKNYDYLSTPATIEGIALENAKAEFKITWSEFVKKVAEEILQDSPIQ